MLAKICRRRRCSIAGRHCREKSPAQSISSRMGALEIAPSSSARPRRRAREHASEHNSRVPMVEETTNLDEHRGMMAQKATELRRLRAEVEADQAALRARQQELEVLLAAAPATNWAEAVEKARYLLDLFSQTAEGDDPHRRTLIGRVLADFDFLLTQPRPGQS